MPACMLCMGCCAWGELLFRECCVAHAMGARVLGVCICANASALQPFQLGSPHGGPQTPPLPSPPRAALNQARAHRATSCRRAPRASASSRSGACTRAAAARGRAPPTSTRRTPRARRRRRPIGCLLVWLLIWECVWGVVCVIWCCPCVVVLVCVPREGKDYGGSPHACMHEVRARALPREPPRPATDPPQIYT